MIELDFYNELSNEDYHKLPALGSTNIKDILKNPYKFASGIRMKQTQAMVIGSAIHCLILEPHKFNDEYSVPGEKSLDSALNDFGKTKLSKSDYETAKECADSVLREAGSLFQGGIAEQPFFSTFDGVAVKCKPDYYKEEFGLVIDVKKCQDASPDGFQKDAAKYGYYISAPFYMDVLQSLGKRAERFIFVCVEETAPHMVGIYEYDPMSLEFGRAEYKRALDIYKRIDQYKDPIYKDTKDSTQIIQTITVPSYITYKNNASY